jgi:hypothetical protein
MHDNYYTTKNSNDLLADIQTVLENYIEEARGVEKLKILRDFLIEHEKNIVEYYIKQIQ